MVDVERSAKDSLIGERNQYQIKKDLSKEQSSHSSLGQGGLVESLESHDTYESKHRWDPTAIWSPREERIVVRKTDLYLLTWICIMFFGLQLGKKDGVILI